jgi:hypothetical protein
MRNNIKKFLTTRCAVNHFTIAALSIAMAVPSARADGAKPSANIFPEGNFESLDGIGWFMGWPDVPNPNDLPWKGGARMSVGEELIEGKTKNRFARIKTTPEYAGFYSASGFVALPEGTKQVTLSIRSRAKVEDKPKSDWRGARLSIQLQDADGVPLKGVPQAVIGDVQDTREEWKVDQKTLDLPDGTGALYVSLIVGGLVGQFDFDDLTVVVTKGPVKE